ncbi:hypothetical protein THAOC_36210 [Thalassiosira oceanica]|uniref:Uncharacterized protein n=1 Tax=Thalassiosira oceanica TaxID=159749 RepID=K0R8U5_THAOC|nr:hypothetical protein THAOC_36210 [Thalassiosira oceanica]|eukprot:EJK45186.1 hypothetical protein THAOC_36210 [Thalassiosira oceanica]
MTLPRDDKRARMLPGAALDALGNDLLVRCASYLDADGLAQLGRTSARFGIPQAGQQRSLANEAARQRFRQSATDEDTSRLPKYDDESDVGLLRALEQLRQPLRFDELAGYGFSPQEHPASVTNTGRPAGWLTAVSGHAMRGGRHFVEFEINDQQSSVIHLGVIRPVSLTDGIDLEADWKGNVIPACVSSGYKPATARPRELRSKIYQGAQLLAPVILPGDSVHRRAGRESWSPTMPVRAPRAWCDESRHPWGEEVAGPVPVPGTPFGLRSRTESSHQGNAPLGAPGAHDVVPLSMPSSARVARAAVEDEPPASDPPTPTLLQFTFPTHEMVLSARHVGRSAPLGLLIVASPAAYCPRPSKSSSSKTSGVPQPSLSSRASLTAPGKSGPRGSAAGGNRASRARPCREDDDPAASAGTLRVESSRRSARDERGKLAAMATRSGDDPPFAWGRTWPSSASLPNADVDSDSDSCAGLQSPSGLKPIGDFVETGRRAAVPLPTPQDPRSRG